MLTEIKSPKEMKVSDSLAEMTQIVLPNDTNMLGHLLGGTLMHWIDLVGAIVANRHCRKLVVTAAMEGLDFHSPIHLGHLAILKGRIHGVGTSSMEVGVEVYSENTLSGEQSHTSSAILTFVAVGADGRPSSVPGLTVTGNEENMRFREAMDRRERRLKRLGKAQNP
jgi:acyl-CoA hydrolase